MSKEKDPIPDAWEDDWESQADKLESTPQPSQVEEPPKVSKAERLAQHAETNKKLWQSAEEPQTFHFLAARDNVPLKSDFKPALKVLSRKPTPKIIEKVDPVTGLAKMALEDEDDEDEQKKNVLSPEEARLKAQREREEKQKRYDEARARILGISTTKSGGSSPGTVTPPSVGGYEDGNGKGIGSGSGSGSGSRGRGRGRGGAGRADGQVGGQKELFDPNYTPKSGGVTIQKRGGAVMNARSTPREEDGIIRAPRGPDGAGYGFANRHRGGKTS